MWKHLLLYLYLSLSLCVISANGHASAMGENEEELTEDAQLAKTRTILAIDGGGVRGIIPAELLSNIERKLSHPLSRYFDVMSGTSTGAIIALGLNVPADPEAEVLRPVYTAQDIVHFYEKFSPVIFSAETAHPYESVWGWAGPYYSTQGIEKAAEAFYGDTLLDETLTNVVVPGFDIERYRPIYFCSHRAALHDHDNFYMRDVAIAACSAPTYFTPKRLFSLDGSRYSVIDGGIVANNPGLIAYAQAHTIFTESPPTHLLVSLGTGQVIKTLKHRDMAKKGKIGWAQEVISLMLKSELKLVDDELRMLLPERIGQLGIQKQYYRLQGVIEQKHERLDNSSFENLEALKHAADRFSEDFKDDIEEIATKLEAIYEARYLTCD